MLRSLSILAGLAVARPVAAAQLSTSTLALYSNVADVAEFVVAALGPALDFELTEFHLAEHERNAAEIASLSGLYNGGHSWNVGVSSANGFYLKIDDPYSESVGFRYAVDWVGSVTGGEAQNVKMGYYLRPNRMADPEDDTAWASYDLKGGLQTVVNDDARVLEYLGTLSAVVFGGQQWVRGEYSDQLTVTFSAEY